MQRNILGESGRLVASDEFCDGGDGIKRLGYAVQLFRDFKGYFLYLRYLYENTHDEILRLDKVEAMDIYEDLPVKHCTYYSAFGGDYERK